VINRSESRLIALEQRNQAQRSKQKPEKTPTPETKPVRKAG
jgi:hypothetical protein